MVLSEPQGHDLIEQVLALSQADSASVSIASSQNTNIRFANNDLTTNGSIRGLSLTVSSSFATRSASVTIDRTDIEALKEAVARSEAMAKLAPENPEFMPPLGPQAYAEPKCWDEATASAGMADLAAKAAPVLEASRKAGVKSAGYLECAAVSRISGNSAGLFLYQPETGVDFSMTSRIEEGRGSGWASRQSTTMADIDLAPVGQRAIEKSLASRNAVAADPGRYPVILEASAVRDLVRSLIYALDRRSVDEGRSFLNGLGGLDAIGAEVFGHRATVRSDPGDARVASSVADWSGLPAGEETWIEAGKLKQLHCGRYWAKHESVDAQSMPTNLLVDGEGKDLADMMSGVERGILVTRLWYIRMVQPQTLLLTGLTRDGTFLIENGEVVGPVKNFRFNESPINVLKNLAASGVPERVLGSETASPMLVPPMLVDGFNLSSVSDAS